MLWESQCTFCIVGILPIEIEKQGNSKYFMLKLERLSVYSRQQLLDDGSFRVEICEGNAVVKRFTSNLQGEELTKHICQIISDLGLDIDPYAKKRD